MKTFPEKDPNDLTRNEISQILDLEKKLNTQTLFYKPKNDAMPEICFPFYDKQGNKENAFKNGRIKNVVVCRFKDCNAVLVCPSGSIK